MINRFATLDDIEFIVDCHLKSFPDSFLSSFGNKFLYEFYITFLPNIIVCVSDCTCKDSMSNKCFYGFVAFSGEKLVSLNISRKKFLFKYFIFDIKKIPLFIVKFIMNKIALRKIPANSLFIDSLAVNPEFRNKGIARSLLNAVKSEHELIFLFTDYSNNDPVIKFYNNNDFFNYFIFNQTFTRKMLCLRYKHVS